MAQRRLRRIKRAEDNFMFTPLQLEHFRIAKRLRQDRVTRIKITKSHSVAVALRAARLIERRGYTLKSREAHVCARIHIKIEHKGVGGVRFNDLGVELYEDRVLAKDRIFVHRFEIERDEKGPGHVRIDALAAFDAEYLRDV